MNRILKASPAALMLWLAPLLGLGCGDHPESATPGPSAASMAYPLETLQLSGGTANRINLVVLGDGYRLEDQAKLTRDAQSWLNAFRKTPPYGNYAAYFNVKLVHVVSNEDGADHGMHGLGVARDTALGAAFQNASPPGQPPDFRLLVVDNALAQAVATANVPECTKLFVIVNDSNYGGSGGAVPVFSVNANSGLIALHEFGHSFGGLADEYAHGDTSALPGFIEAYPNVTTLQVLDQIKWKGWIEPGMPLPTPDTGTHADHLGLFEGAYYRNGGVFRPRHACRMRSLNDSFCEVCAEAIVRGIYGRVAPIDAASPPSPVSLDTGGTATFSITHPVPTPDTLRVAWTVDGVAVAGDGDHLTLPGSGLKPGSHEIRAHLIDTTPLVRHGREALGQIHTWTVNIAGTTALAALFSSVPKQQQHQLLRVMRDGAGFKVVDRQIIDLPLPKEPSQGIGAWHIEALGPKGQVLFSQGMEDPSLLRGEFQNPVDSGRIDGYRLGGDRPLSFLVRMPLMEAHRLEAFHWPQGAEGRIRLGGVILKVDSNP